MKAVTTDWARASKSRLFIESAEMKVDIIVQFCGALLVALTIARGMMAAVSFAVGNMRTRHHERQRSRQLKALLAGVGRQPQAQRSTTRSPRPAKRRLKVARRVIETPSGDVCSFYLVPADGQPLATYSPGQFLAFEFTIPGTYEPIIRSYSLSETPTNPQNFYRVTVKKLDAPDGAASDAPSGKSSTFFLDQLGEGSMIDVTEPAGAFCLNQASQRPVVLIGSGSGITPLVSMLNWLVATKSQREIWFFQGVRNRREHAFFDHLRQHNRAFPNVHLVVFYSQPSQTCRKGFDYDFVGRVTVNGIKSFLKARDYEFYVCGPAEMIPTIKSGLRSWGVPETNIFSESFGAASPLANVQSTGRPGSVPGNAAESGIRVHFARSGRKVGWSGRQGSLLELVEACGVPVRYGCRAGQCGTCKTGLRSGDVEYRSTPGVEVEAGSCLLCIAQPKTDVVLDL